jgi:hypothetical protein
MSARRPLAAVLGDVAAGALEMASRVPGIGLRRVEITIPLEVAVSRGPGGLQVLGDVPRTVTRTAFDLPPGTLKVLWSQEVP